MKKASVLIENIENGYLITVYAGGKRIHFPKKDEMIEFIKKHFK